MKKRQSNFEILRIISMVLILIHHFSVHTRWESSSGLTNKKIFIEAIGFGGKLGVNIFLLISGFFLVGSVFKMKKVINLWLQVATYSIGFYLLFALITRNPEMFTIRAFSAAFFPITFNSYWFMTTYFLLYLLSPYINILIEHMTKKQFIQLLIILGVFLSIMPTISNIISRYGTSEVGLWFILMYLVAAFIRKYPENFTKSATYYFFISFFLFILSIGIFIGATIYNNSAESPISKEFIIGLYNPPFVLLAIFLFLAFRNLNTFYNYWINVFGGATLGVYLIHDNNQIRSRLWGIVYKLIGHFNGFVFIFSTIVILTAIYVICTFVELLRKKYLERFYLK